ncbi:MAG: hypothetical protein J0I04_06510 [Paenarthrobacter ureafaciens]|uniref:Orn/Lys/Arg family decarboxylase n=1 Tax=Paenarthrobacter ureafaciens TaxID=37931 RepID=UPI001AD5CDA0|nr:hypothetical protein [Paenarthrobacter ureafaciens]MBN9129289.1 hypothetical protein [Paenarthrobacter ureafaciens]
MHRTIAVTPKSAGLAPLAAKLDDLAAGRVVRSFHALPLLGATRDMPAPVKAGFEALFQHSLPTGDLSFSGRALDSFFAPDGPLAAAQTEAAAAFAAEAAFFGTCGTTVSNRAALLALARDGGRVLIDGASHQSVMFTATAAQLPMTIIEPVDVKGCALTDVDSMAGRLSAAAHSGKPYAVAVITATSYDGYILDMRNVLRRLVEASPSTALLIDSAWGAVHSFSGRLRRYTALSAVNELRSAKIKLPPIVVTSSAHKTLCALSCSPAGLQLNFHIGVSTQDADDLVQALRGLAHRAGSTASVRLAPVFGSTVDHYVVPYPPGIPIAVPGDTWCERKQQAALREEAAGAHIFHVDQPARVEAPL